MLGMHSYNHYENIEYAFTFLQEEEYLRKSVKKITSLKVRPDVIVVEKSVSRLAQDFLLKSGITLI